MDYLDSWRYLFNHEIFKNDYHDSAFQKCLDIEVVKVNKDSNMIDDDDTLNTKVQVWLECGSYLGLSETGSDMIEHDIELDCGADTFEEAIIKLAKLVRENY